MQDDACNLHRAHSWTHQTSNYDNHKSRKAIQQISSKQEGVQEGRARKHFFLSIGQSIATGSSRHKEQENIDFILSHFLHHLSALLFPLSSASKEAQYPDKSKKIEKVKGGGNCPGTLLQNASMLVLHF